MSILINLKVNNAKFETNTTKIYFLIEGITLIFLYMYF